MKRIIFPLIVFLSIILHAENSTKIVSVNTNSFTCEISFTPLAHKDLKKGKSTVVDYYEFEDYSKGGKYNLPSYYLVFAIPPNSHPKIVVKNKTVKVLKNTIPALHPFAKRINDSTIIPIYSGKYVGTVPIKRKDIEIENYFWYRDFYCVSIKINTHKFLLKKNSIDEIQKITLKFIFNNGVKISSNRPLRLLNNFDKTISNLIEDKEIAEQFRSNMPKDLLPDTTYQWIDFNADYIKISVGEDGIYRFYGSDIANAGYNLINVIPAKIKLFESGKQVPILIVDGNDGSFDESDYIEFYGHKNYPFGNYKEINEDDEDYNEYENRFTDTTYYFLNWSGNTRQTVFLQKHYNKALADTLNYYTEILHYETDSWIQNMNGDETLNQLPDWHKNKTWYWEWIGYWSPDKICKFDAPDFIENKDFRVFSKATTAGLTNSMRFKLSVNDVKLDSQNVNKFQQVLLDGEFNSSILQTTNNELKLQCFSEDRNYAAHDWNEIDYPKLSSFVNDSLMLTVHWDVQNSERIIKVNNAERDEYLIYKIYPKIKKISSYLLSNGELYFSDTVKAGDKYFIVASSKIKNVASYYAKHFINLRSSQYQADYIAVTHPVFSTAVEQYLGYISSQYSLNVLKVLVSDIFDEFSYGYPYPEGIRLFFYKAYTEWQEPKPEFTVLIGDASYDYKYKKYKNTGVKLSVDYVPSHGYPVGDYWYVVWDKNAPPVPQLKLGRLPILDEEQLEFYRSKIQLENESAFNSWNKQSLFFSGGNPQTPSELDLFRNTNNEIINSSVVPRPYAGRYTHFYKTIDPPTDFGPYSQEEVNKTISSGGLFIAYLGHSGTATWDNGINSTIQLQNDVGRYPLITDFGCSTNKFAEPDIVCFGERFTLNSDGQAIGYMGNSSLGFFTTVTNVSKLFYKEMIVDSLYRIGDAHLAAKAEMFNTFGNSNVYKIFSYGNILLGDPVVEVKFPPKPNMSVNQASLLTDVSNLDETMDSVLVKFSINNFGLSYNDSVKIRINEKYSGEELNTEIFKIEMPVYSDTITYYVHSKNKPGPHIISVFIDPENNINEIYENDNFYVFDLNVYSYSARDLLPNKVVNGKVSQLKILNPVTKIKNIDEMLLMYADNNNFNSSQTQIIPLGKFYTTYVFNNLLDNQRYWIKYKLNTEEAEFGYIKSFYQSIDNKFLLSDSLSFSLQNIKGIEYNRGVALANENINISVLSAGAYSGATCLIAKNGENLISNTFLAGMAIAVFDSVTLNVDTAFSILLFQQPGNVHALANFINNDIPTGKIVAMGVSDDARNNMSEELRNAIKTLGSTKIDSLFFKGPWALIGYKGAPADSVIEEVRSPYQGQIYIDKTYIVYNSHGTLSTTLIGPASSWDKITVSDSLPGDSQIKYRILGQIDDSQFDTLGCLSFNDGEANLSALNDSGYSFIKVMAELNASSDFISPVLQSIGVNYAGFAELGTNYQVVTLEKDTVGQGETVNLNFKVYNVGEISADSFNVKVDLLNPDNSSRNIFSAITPKLEADTNISYDVSFATDDFKGDGQFRIVIDSENKVRETFKDNNYYVIPFFVLPDTTTPKLEVSVDGKDILDGEYISVKPEIRIMLSDDSQLAITDTSSVIIKLNDEQIYFNNPDRETFTSNDNPKYVVTYTPTLANGDYTLYINGKDANGNFAYPNGIEKKFKVSNEPKLLKVYNYPNPFSDVTYFTFKLTQIPDKMTIDIYTVAGRKIREIKILPSELNYDFNKILWDGRDQDGDRIANGVYFYKIKMKKNEKEITQIQKLAVMR